MVDLNKRYLQEHLWGIIQAVSGVYCAAFATWDRFHPRTVIASPNPAVGPIGVQINPAYAMSLWLWVGIVVLALSVAVPAIVGLVRRDSPPAKAGPSKEELEVDAEQKRWHEWVNNHNLKYYYEMGVQSSQLFTPIQIQALQLAKDLGTFVLELGPEPQLNLVETSLESALHFHMVGPGSQWHLKLQSHYEERFSPRIKKLLLELGKEGQSDSVLSALAYAAKTSDHVALVRARLWMVAALRDGITLEVTGEN